MASAHHIPDDNQQYHGASYAHIDVDALDNDRYAEFNSKVYDSRSGRQISEPPAPSSRDPSKACIIAALDYNSEEHRDNVMKVTKKIAQPGTTVVLFNVFTPSGGENSDARTKAMNELASQFPEGVETLTHVVTGKPDTAVLATAKHYNADLIILGRRKLKGIRKLTSSSVSDAVVNSAQCSVLIAK